MNEIQKGLLQKIIVGRYTKYSELHAEEGYYFYDRTVDVYDEEGNLETERIYMKYCSTPEISVEELNARFVSVPIE